MLKSSLVEMEAVNSMGESVDQECKWMALGRESTSALKWSALWKRGVTTIGSSEERCDLKWSALWKRGVTAIGSLEERRDHALG